ncbi:MAG: phage integrase N-terminal SAM-like domain-containing protein [Nitrospiria bacterium]
MDKQVSYKTLDERKVMDILHFRHYSFWREASYTKWVTEFIRFNDKRHPREMGLVEVEGFLSHFGVNKKDNPLESQQAMEALSFLYRDVLNQPLDDGFISNWSNGHQNRNRVLSRNETSALFKMMEGSSKLIAKLLYGSGLDLTEVIRIRVHDLDFVQSLVHLFDEGRNKVSKVFLPKPLHMPLKKHLREVEALYESDLKTGRGDIYLPEVLESKYLEVTPSREWQYVFSSKSLSKVPCKQGIERDHMDETVLEKAVSAAIEAAAIATRICCDSLRDAFSNHLLASVVNIRMHEVLLGQEGCSTEVYSEALKDTLLGINSPLFDLESSGSLG